jgi:hypothetical protein
VCRVLWRGTAVCIGASTCRSKAHVHKSHSLVEGHRIYTAQCLAADRRLTDVSKTQRYPLAFSRPLARWVGVREIIYWFILCRVLPANKRTWAKGAFKGRSTSQYDAAMATTSFTRPDCFLSY